MLGWDWMCDCVVSKLWPQFPILKTISSLNSIQSCIGNLQRVSFQHLFLLQHTRLFLTRHAVQEFEQL